MHHRIPLSIEVRKVLKLLMYTLFGLLIILSVYFFIKASGTAESGYSLRENQVKKSELEAENRILKQRVLDAQSLNKLETSDVKENMAEPVAPVFVEPRGPLSRRK
jgi:hypothetical protein